MFTNATINSLSSTASIEIFVMLTGSFILWMLFSRALRPRSVQVEKDNDASNSITHTKSNTKTISDDLQLIQWIGPGLEKVLRKNWVTSYDDIISMDISWLEKLLISLWGRYESYNPTTWPDQADLAKRKKWSELEEYQEIMKNSKKKDS